ncbi:hypothetical protein D9758_017224 [Tetrapyrgos nigripes]|uniref:DUF6535 domain-containing protein n=1 Tax=Tetrapyrgos nigripes TaxID=182062 RepID=A0A8H5C119_9AGAR|nr:hypothetical protein D9758_017224 [Tetrapyrgos nigripes]
MCLLRHLVLQVLKNPPLVPGLAKALRGLACAQPVHILVCSCGWLDAMGNGGTDCMTGGGNEMNEKKHRSSDGTLLTLFVAKCTGKQTPEKRTFQVLEIDRSAVRKAWRDATLDLRKSTRAHADSPHGLARRHGRRAVLDNGITTSPEFPRLKEAGMMTTHPEQSVAWHRIAVVVSNFLSVHTLTLSTTATTTTTTTTLTMNDPQSQRKVPPSVPNIPQSSEKAQNSLSDAEKGQAGIGRRQSSEKSSAPAGDNAGNEKGKGKEPKSDPSQSVPASTASVPLKPGSAVKHTGRDVGTTALPQSVGHSIRSNSTSSQRSSNAQDARTDSEVRNVMEEKSKSEPMVNNNTKNEAAPGVPGKPNSQETKNSSEGGMVPDNLSDSIAQITKGLDVLLSLITESTDDSENVQQHVNETKKKKGNLHRLLGIMEYQSPYTGTQDYDYTCKYPQDELGKGASENARVWKVYLDEAEAFDDEMLKGFRDTLDALLVFAALFSAVVTSFVISTVVNLQPNYTEITARLVFEQNNLLRAAMNTTALQSVPHASVDLDNADVSTKDLWINGLFFASLSLSLATALLSVLVKQWLQAYTLSLPTGNAQERAKICQFRYLGFEKWKVPEIIGLLPIILHASLSLFMAGLSVYVSELHESLCWIVVSVTSISFLMYFGSIIIPAIHIQCPYRVPILFSLLQLLMFPLSIFQYFWKLVTYHGQRYYYYSQNRLPKWPSAPNTSLRHAEAMFLKQTPPTFNVRNDQFEISPSYKRHHNMLAYCLQWLQDLQSNNSIQEVVHQAMHGVFLDTTLKYPWGDIYQPALKCYVDLDWNSVEAFIWDTLRRRDETDNHKVCSSLYSLWRKAKEISNFPPQESGYALHDAAENGYFHIVKVLVENGADVNAGEGFYGFALQAAAFEGDLDIVKHLVENGADVNAKGGEFGFALHAAAEEGHLDIVKYLVEKGADVNAKEGDIWGHLDIVKYLVEKGADVDAEGGEYGFPLRAAAYMGHLDIFKYLVEKGADVDAEEGLYGFALQAAAEEGHLDIFKYLVGKGEDVNAKEGEYGFALQAAAEEGHLDIVKYLVEKGEDVNAKEGEYGFALQAAAEEGHLDIVKYLVEKGADVNTKGGKYGSALKAAQEGFTLSTLFSQIRFEPSITPSNYERVPFPLPLDILHTKYWVSHRRNIRANPWSFD